MLSYSGYPDDALEHATAYLQRRAASTDSDWSMLRNDDIAEELARVENGWQLARWTSQHLDYDQETKLQAAIRQARHRAKQSADTKPVSVSLTRQAAAALTSRAKRDKVTRSAALLSALDSDQDKPDKASLAVTAANMVLAGISYRLVAAFWNLSGVDAPADAAKWTGTTVKRLIDETGAVERALATRV